MPIQLKSPCNIAFHSIVQEYGDDDDACYH